MEAEIRQTHPHDLGYEIPALSFAAGGTKITSFLASQAIDMKVRMEDGWPEERLGEFGTDWFHSDFKDVAYRYTYKLFDDLVNKGNLK